MVYREESPTGSGYVQVTPKSSTYVTDEGKKTVYEKDDSGGYTKNVSYPKTSTGGISSGSGGSSKQSSPIINPIRYPVQYLESQGITPEVLKEAEKAPSPVVNKVDYGKYQVAVKQQQDFSSKLRYVDTSKQTPFRPPYIPYKMPSGEYYKKEGQFYYIPPELKYVITHSDPRESSSLISSLGSPNRFENSFSSAYESLTRQEKIEYGYTYVPFKDEPMEEWKFHPGGVEYMKAHKGDVIDEYIQSLGGIDKVPLDVYKYASEGGIWSGKKPDDPSLRREQVWENLMYDETGRRELYFSRLPGPARWYSSAFHAGVVAASFPITLPQMGVKLVTGEGDFFERLESGKTLFLPDVGKALEEFQPGGPRGIISTGISTGISYATGNELSDLNRFAKDPISGVFASAGEIFGLYLGGQAWNVAKVSTIKGLGYARSGLMKYTGWNIPGYESFMRYTPSNLIRKAWWGAKEKLGMAKYVPEEEVWNLDVLIGGKKFAESPGAGSQYKLFQLTRDNPLFESDIIGIHTSPHRFGNIIRVGKGSSETPGLSISSFGEGSPHFLNVSGYSGYSTGGFSLFPKFKLPTAPIFRLKEVFRIPKWLRGKSYESSSKFILENPKGPYGWIAPKSELGGPEIEAIIRAGTWGKRADSFFYTTFKGRIVPLPEYNLFGSLPDMAGSSVSSNISKAVKDFVSFSSSGGPKTIPIINPGYIMSSISSYPSKFPSSIHSYDFSSLSSSFNISSIDSLPSYSLSSFKSSIGSNKISSVGSGSSGSGSSYPSYPSSIFSSTPSPPSSRITSYISAPPTIPNYSASPHSPLYYKKTDYNDKRLMKLVKSGLGTGYRQRHWNMPSLQDFFDRKSFKKFMKGGM